MVTELPHPHLHTAEERPSSIISFGARDADFYILAVTLGREEIAWVMVPTLH